MEDAKIIDLYWKRDENAIAETDHKYGCFCHTIAIRLLGVREDADNCVPAPLSAVIIRYTII